MAQSSWLGACGSWCCQQQRKRSPGSQDDLVGYNFNKNVGVRFEYENFGKFSSNGGVGGSAIKGDNWGISLKYAF